METIRFERLTLENFGEHSLDEFKRHQVCNKWIRKNEDKFFILEKVFVEDWYISKLRDIAKGEIHAIESGDISYGAFHEDRVVGFARICTEQFGSNNQYMELKMIHVSEDFRGMGIGRKLFKIIADNAKEMGALKLYISAHSSVESQAFYKSLGCTEALEIDEIIQSNEPYDVQMEYILQGGCEMKFNKLIPELTVTDIEITREFYVEKLGFKLEYERPEDKFIFLSIDGSQFMFEQHHLEGWNTAMLVYPYGRGINFSISVDDVEEMYYRAKKAGLTFYKELCETSYDIGEDMITQWEFLIQDPDGYLLRFTD